MQQTRMTPNDMINEKLDAPVKTQTARSGAVNETRVLDTTDLFRGENEIIIRHDGAIYRMKITRQGKLILNK